MTAPSLRWLLLVVLLFALATGGLVLADLPQRIPAAQLQFVMQTMLMTGGSALVALLAGRAFVGSGEAGSLCLGAGALAFALSGLGPWLINDGSANNTVTLHNLCVWTSAMLHLAGVGASGVHARRNRARVLVGAYGMVLTVALLIGLAAAEGLTPQFFVEGQGGTPLRQVVLGSAAAMFALSGLLLARRVLGAPASDFRHWYGAGLLLVATGLAAVLAQRALDTPLNWMGRATQWVASVFFVIAAVQAGRSQRPADRLDLAAAPSDPWLRYGLAIVFVGAAAILRLVFLERFGNVMPFEQFYVSVLLATLYGGWGPGALALAFSALAGTWLWVEPRYQLAWGTAPEQIALLMFLLTGSALVVLVSAMQRARLRAQAAEFDATMADERRAAIERTRLGEARYRALFDSVDQGVCIAEMVTDATGRAIDYRFIDINPAFGPMTGLPASAVGRTALELVPDLEPRWVQTYARVGLGGETLHFEDRSAPMQRVFDVFATPIEPRGRFVMLFTDITERRAAEAAQRLAARRDRHALQITTELRGLDDPLEVLRGASRLLREQLGAERVVYFVVEGDSYVVTADSAHGVPPLEGTYASATFGAHLLATYRAGRTAVCPDVAADTGITPRERAAFRAIDIGAYIGVPVLKGGEFVAGMAVHRARAHRFDAEEIALAEDTAARTWAIVERTRADAALRRSESVFRTLGEALPDFLWMSAADGTPIYQNPAWHHYTGLTTDDLARGGWQQMPHPDDLERLNTTWARAMALPQPFELEFRCRRHDGVYRWFLARTIPVFDDDGTLLKWVGTTTDIHDRIVAGEQLERTARQLEDADRLKNEFLAMLAHELRNPLAPLRNASRLLRLQHDDAASRDRACDVIDRQLLHMTRLIDDLLDASRITLGRIELRLAPTLLADAVALAVETSRPQIEVNNQRLELRLPDAPVRLNADLTRLAQMFANLLHNAAKYSPRDTLVTLAAQVEGDEVVVSVSDKGIGIAPEMLPRIFGLFEQADRSIERSRGGLGIGLTLVQRIVDLHGGSARAHSAGLGLGSRFEVRLPLAPASDTADPAPPPRSEGIEATDDSEPPGAVHRVLVVDDNRDAAETLGMLLQLAGKHVRTADDGADALRVAASFKPEVVLLDLGMPHMNGYDAARAMRLTAWGERAVLIATTGWGQEADLRRTREAGFDHHLVKPVDPQALMKLLDSIAVV